MDVKNRDIAEDVGSTVEKKIKKKIHAADFLKNAFFGLVYALCGYFLNGIVLPFGAAPFGIALLCASDRRVFYIYAGLCLSAFGSESKILLISVYSALVLLRMLVRFLIDTPWSKKDINKSGDITFVRFYPHLFSENIALRMASAATGGFAIGLYYLIEGGMMFYDLYGTIVTVLVAPISVLLAGGFFNKVGNKYYRLVGFLGIAFGVIYALGDRKLYGIALGAAVCMFVTLYITRKGGTVLGMLSGALLGLAISIETLPIFAFAALVFGLLCNTSVSLAVGGALSVAVAWGVYVKGIGILNGLAAALVSAALIYGTCDKLFISAKKEKTTEDSTSTPFRTISRAPITEELLKARASDANERIMGVKESFSEMSEVLYSIAKKLKTPAASDIKQICDNAFDSSCVSCEYKSSCWGEKYRETSDALINICATLQKKGSVSVDETDNALVSVCPRITHIISEINHNTYLHTRELIEGDKTEVFALDYSVVADFMDKMLFENEIEYISDNSFAARISSALADGDIEVDAVGAFGERKKRIVILGNNRDRLNNEKEKIFDILSAVCPFKINAGELDEKEAVLRFCEKEDMSFICVKRSLCAEGEDKYCGDTSALFKTQDGRLCAFISDGMGAGREAAITSGIVGMFLRKFLLREGAAENTLKLINGFLRNRCGGSLHECSATVDLMELDLYTHRAAFYKSGAAPTYVFRNGSLFKLRSHTVPVGIISELDFRRIDFDVDIGDLIVMISDGVTDGKEECPWLFDLLRSQGENTSVERMADLIVKYAKGEGASDDISVLVIKLT